MNLMTAMLCLILTAWVTQAIRLAMRKEKLLRHTAINIVAGACLIIGAVGFFGTALSGSGALDWLPDSFEWPVTSTDNGLILDDGNIVFPHTSSSRIQIYDRHREYLRGWTVESDGGDFKIAPSTDPNFYVYTARGDLRHEFNAQGERLSSGRYSEEYSKIRGANEHVEFDTALYLWPFTHPFTSWLFAAIGLILAALSIRRKRRGSNKPVPPPSPRGLTLRRFSSIDTPPHSVGR